MMELFNFLLYNFQLLPHPLNLPTYCIVIPHFLYISVKLMVACKMIKNFEWPTFSNIVIFHFQQDGSMIKEPMSQISNFSFRKARQPISIPYAMIYLTICPTCIFLLLFQEKSPLKIFTKPKASFCIHSRPFFDSLSLTRLPLFLWS